MHWEQWLTILQELGPEEHLPVPNSFPRNGSPPMRRGLRDEARFSLVELLVALSLLSIAIIPMVAMFDISERGGLPRRGALELARGLRVRRRPSAGRR